MGTINSVNNADMWHKKTPCKAKQLLTRCIFSWLYCNFLSAGVVCSLAFFATIDQRRALSSTHKLLYLHAFSLYTERMDKQYRYLSWMFITLLTVVQLFAPVSQLFTQTHAQNLTQPIPTHEYMHEYIHEQAHTAQPMQHSDAHSDTHSANTDTPPHCAATLCTSVCASHCMSATPNSIVLVAHNTQNQFERAPAFKHETSANQPNTPPPKAS